MNALQVRAAGSGALAVLAMLAAGENLLDGSRELSPAFPATMDPAIPGYYLAYYAGSPSGARVIRYFDGREWRICAGGNVTTTYGKVDGDSWQAVFTDWYPADVAPAHVGLYTREYPDADCRANPDLWDGAGWRIVDAGDASVHGVACFRWRGIEPISTAPETLD